MNKITHWPSVDYPDLLKFKKEESDISFRQKYLNLEPIPHDDIACKALEEYESECKKIEAGCPLGHFVPFNFSKLMSDTALKYGTTVKEMKKHWRCIEIAKQKI